MSPKELASNGVRALLSAALVEVKGIHQAAYLLAGFALLSQLLGLVRDRLLAASFGASTTLDVYYASFRIPDLLFATVASLLSLYALLPVLSRLEGENEARMVSFLRRTLLVFFVGMAVVAGIVWLLAPLLIPLIAPGVAGEELLSLTRIILLQPILLGASNIVAALTQLKHRFLLYSISPLLYNFGIIIGITALYPTMGITGLGWGVVLGALMHLSIQLPFFTTQRQDDRVSWGEVFRGLRGVLILSVPRTLALSAGQISLLVLTALASLLSPGSITVFMFAWNLQAVPLAIIGVSYSVAAFPTLSRLHATGQHSEFVRHIEVALRHILFWTIPAVVLIIVLRAQLVRTILGSGAFDWDATRLTAAALALFIVSLSAQSVSLLVARAYYAAGETLKPLLFAGTAVVTTTLGALLLVAGFHLNDFARNFLEVLLRVDEIPGTTVLMLVLAYSLGALVQSGAGLYFFTRDFSFARAPLVRLFFQSFSASVLGGASAYGTLALMGGFVDINTLAGILTGGFVAGSIGLAVTALVLVLLKNQELAETYGALRRRVRSEPPVLEPTDVS